MACNEKVDGGNFCNVKKKYVTDEDCNNCPSFNEVYTPKELNIQLLVD